ncbi:MAG: head-tail connector protein [Pseudomonadota bacterium]
MSLTLITPPVSEPVSLDDLKAHLRVTEPVEDSLIAGLGRAARQALEARFEIAIMSQVWRLSLDCPPATVISLPVAPLVSVSEVSLTLNDGTVTVFDPSAYDVDPGFSGRICLKAPHGYSAKLGALKVDFVAGWPSLAQVPEPIVLAIKILAAHFYEHREEAGTDRFFTSPQSLSTLMAPYRRVHL